MDALDLPAALVLLLCAAASARLWRLAAIDEAGAPLRRLQELISDRLAGPEVVASQARLSRRRQMRIRAAASLEEGWHCPYCLGLWIAVALVASALAWHETVLWQLVVGAFALNYVAATINALIDKAAAEE